jgi:hypothetical protein
VSSIKIPLYNIPDVDETFSTGALWRQWVNNHLHTTDMPQGIYAKTVKPDMYVS